MKIIKKYTGLCKNSGFASVLLLFSALLTMALMTWTMDSSRFMTSSAASPAVSMPAVEDPACSGIIRFHIKANSDSAEDQALKLQVRNHVLAKVQNHLMDCFTREASTLHMKKKDGSNSGPDTTESLRLALTRQWLTENMAQIEAWAEETVRAEGYDYPVTATLGITWIPEREYDGIYFPPGNYEALTLHIGEGTGQNWWCVLFPPLCLIDCGEELGQARFESVLENRIVLKSRIRELLEQR